MNKFNKKKLIILILVLLAIITSSTLLWIKISSKNLDKISYNKFIKLVEEKEVQKVFINFSSEDFIFEDVKGNRFRTDNPNDIDFKKFLLKNNIEVLTISISFSAIFIEVIFMIIKIGFVFIVLRGVTKEMGLGIFKKKETEVSTIPNVSFENLVGNKEFKNDIQFLVSFLKNPEKYYSMGAKLPKGVVLYGPPGTGKTLTAKAIAGEAKVPFLSVSGSDFIEMYVGLGSRRVRELFKEARKKAPCIVFIDEIDAIGTNRGRHGGNSEQDQTINALLAELDGFKDRESIVVIVATNRIEDLDPALIRHGRFDKHIAINLPEYKDRLKILQKYSKNKRMSENVNLEEIARMTVGFSGASLKTLINEATILAVNREKCFVEKEDIDDTYFKIVMRGHRKESKDTNKDELELVAYHEAGHALCTKLLTNNNVPKVTVIPFTSGYGGATLNIPKKINLLTKNEILNNIKILYAGRASEHLLRGDENQVTTGASQDIKQATIYLKKYFNDYGMSKKFGMVRISDLNNSSNLMVDEVVKLSKKLYEETFEILTNNRDKLDKIAKKLIIKETLNEEELDEIINN